MTKGQLTVEVKMQEYSVEKFCKLDFCTLQTKRGKRSKQAARRMSNHIKVKTTNVPHTVHNQMKSNEVE